MQREVQTGGEALEALWGPLSFLEALFMRKGKQKAPSQQGGLFSFEPKDPLRSLLDKGVGETVTEQVLVQQDVWALRGKLHSIPGGGQWPRTIESESELVASPPPPHTHTHHLPCLSI